MRVLFASLGFFSILVLPVWVALIIALVMAFRWRAWEVVGMGLLADLAWLPHEILWGIPFATIITLMLVWFLEPIRRELLL